MKPNGSLLLSKNGMLVLNWDKAYTMLGTIIVNGVVFGLKTPAIWAPVIANGNITFYSY